MTGTIRATAPDGTTVRYTDVLYVPGLKSNLLSYCQLYKKGARIHTREDGHTEITMTDGDEHVLIGVGMVIHGVLMVQYEPALASAHESGHDHPNDALNATDLGGLNVQSAHASITYRTAHKRLGHPSYSSMDATFRNGDVEGLSISDKTNPLKPPCDSCLRGKMSKAPFPTGGDKRTTRPLELVHSDIMDLGDAHTPLPRSAKALPHAPVSQGPTSRTFVAGASATKWKVVQLDISNAFLYPPIDRDVYVRPPEPRRDGDKVWKLKRSVYGLKQAPRLWHQHLRGVLLELDMVQSKSNPSLFIWKRDGQDTVWLLTYVDDILIQSHDAEGIEAVIQRLKQQFTLTVSETMTQFLGFNVTVDNDSIALELTKYISQALATFGMEGSRSGVRTPIAKEPRPQGEPPDEINGQLVLKQVGTLLYISTAGRPDITYAAHVLAWQASKPTAATVLGIHRVFNYLQNTADMGLVYGGGDLVLRGYTDSDYANEIGRHSVGGYVFTLGGAAVSWRTKRQTVIATSTAEAEYIALFEGAREATYLRRLYEDLGFRQQDPTAIALATGEEMSQRIKHMDIRYHWTRKAVRDGVVRPEYCPTAQQAADYLTKPLTAKQHLTCSLLCGLQQTPHVAPSAPSTHIEAAGAALSSPGFSRGTEQHSIA
ncbi:unnamed protein product [Closterium sp. NIES-54]